MVVSIAIKIGEWLFSHLQTQGGRGQMIVCLSVLSMPLLTAVPLSELLWFQFFL